MISQKRLKEVLHYDPKTGIFIWLVSLSPRTKVGQIAGRFTAQGYIQVGIDTKVYLAHRLAWLYVHGVLPFKIDHKNNITCDNWIDNLRGCTSAQNSHNRSRKNKITPNVWGRFVARCMIQGVRYHLGIYATEAEAIQVREKFAKDNHGNFYKG